MRLLQVNVAISTLATAGLAVVAFGCDTGAVLAVFGAWAFEPGLAGYAAFGALFYLLWAHRTRITA